MTRNETLCLLDDLRRIERLTLTTRASAFRADLLSDDFDELTRLWEAPELEFGINERSVDRDLEASTR